MSDTYTALAADDAPVMTETGPLTHAVYASRPHPYPVVYTFSLEAAQAVADAFNALENMDEEFLKEKA
jgi:hypothetical protein